MASPANGFSVLGKNSSDVPCTNAQTLSVASDLIAPIVTLGVIAATSLVMLFNRLFGRVRVDKQGNKIPDGPRGLPIVGSFLFPSRYPELALDHWAEKYGNMYSMWLGNKLFVIVSDPDIAKDLMATHGGVFSSRKELYIKSQTILLSRGITATPYNDRWWKHHRRIAVGWLNQHVVDHYTPVLARETTVLVRSLYNASKGGTVPVNPQSHAVRCSLNNMTTITFGLRTDSVNHQLVGRALELSREFLNCIGPMSNLVDFVPILKLFPSRMQIRGKKLHEALLETYGDLIKTIEAELISGEDVDDCLVKSMFEVRRDQDLDDLDMVILASAFMIHGVETTAAIIQWFSALIPAHPDIQKKAQDELDRVVGRDRLPTIEDEKELPYCHAIVKEVERCHNPFWLGTRHVTTEDFTYNGNFIPKDTVVVLNTWTMHHDPKHHRSPDFFNPDRYISYHLASAESASLADPHAPDHWILGVGQRICPGMIVAEREIWLIISRMLWAFDMRELPDDPIDRKEYDVLSGRSPVPFRIMIAPRHAGVERVLQGWGRELGSGEGE